MSEEIEIDKLGFDDCLHCSYLDGEKWELCGKCLKYAELKDRQDELLSVLIEYANKDNWTHGRSGFQDTWKGNDGFELADKTISPITRQRIEEK